MPCHEPNITYRFVMMRLPNRITEKVVQENTLNKPNIFKEIEEMITTVDKNQDGKINYSEFRVTAFMHILHGHFQIHSF